MSTAIVPLGEYNGVEIHARPDDRYIDVTELCLANGKEWSAFARLKSTRSFVASLASALHKKQASLFYTLGGTGGHTFAEERLALKCAAWISPEFEVWVYDRIRELIRTGSTSITPAYPCKGWTARFDETFFAHMGSVARCGVGAFSVLTAAMPAIAGVEAEMILHGLPAQREDRPDGSIGRLWADDRRDRGLDPTTLRASLRVPLSGGRFFDSDLVAVYPGSERAAFDGWFHHCYLASGRLDAYLGRKFKGSLGVESRPAARSVADWSVSALTGHLPPRPRVAYKPQPMLFGEVTA